jgi:phosphoribosylglycinamide formyltransferase-1
MTYPAIVVAVSGGGSNLQALIDAIAEGQIKVRIALVISDRPDCGGVQRALQQRIPVCAIPFPRQATPAQRADWERTIVALICALQPDLLLLSGFMRILSAPALSALPMPVINQHPALLPADGGDVVTLSDGRVIPALRGAHVVRDALVRQLPVTGCTIHMVVPEVDRGPVLACQEVMILPDDSEETLHARIRAVEQPLLIATLQVLLKTSPHCNSERRYVGNLGCD